MSLKRPLSIDVKRFELLHIEGKNKELIKKGYKRLIFLDLEFITLRNDSSKFYTWEIPYSEITYLIYDIQSSQVMDTITSYLEIPLEGHIEYRDMEKVLNTTKGFLNEAQKEGTLVVLYGSSDLSSIHIATRLIHKEYERITYDYLDVSRLSVYIDSADNSLSTVVQRVTPLDVGKHTSLSDTVMTFLYYLAITEDANSLKEGLFVKEGVILGKLIPELIQTYNGLSYTERDRTSPKLNKYLNNRPSKRRGTYFEDLSKAHSDKLVIETRESINRKHTYLKRVANILTLMNKTNLYHKLSKINKKILALVSLQYTLKYNLSMSNEDIELYVVRELLKHITSHDVLKQLEKRNSACIIKNIQMTHKVGDDKMLKNVIGSEKNEKDEILQEEYSSVQPMEEDIFSGVERISNADNIIDEPDDLVLVDKEVGKLIQDSVNDETQYPYYLTPNTSVTPSSKKGKGKNLMLPYTSEDNEDSIKEGCTEMINGHTYEELQEQIAYLMKENTSLKDLNSVVTQTKSKKEQEYEKALHTKDLEIRELTIRLNNSQATLGNTKKELKEVTEKLDNFTERMFNILVNK